MTSCFTSKNKKMKNIPQECEALDGHLRILMRYYTVVYDDLPHVSYRIC